MNIFAVPIINFFKLILLDLLNQLIIMLSAQVIPPPEGTDLTTLEGIKKAVPLLEPKHYIMPLLAHALGTLSAAFIIARWSLNKNLLRSMLAGVFFLAGGMMAVKMIPAPLWFSITDLVLAYLPMAGLGYLLGYRRTADF